MSKPGYKGLVSLGREGLKGLDKRGLKGLVSLASNGLKGLSIVILQALTPNRQIVISLYRFVYNWGYAGYKGLVIMKDNLVNHLQTREYKRHTNIPIGRYTLDKRFEGLKV